MNSTYKHINYTGLIFLAALLVGCGGTGSFSGGGGGGGGNLTVALGSGTGSSFQPGVLALSSTSLSAGGSASVTATLQNSDGTPYSTSTVISFTSPCFQNGLAAFNVAGTPGNTVTTTTGLASITYVAQGCSGSDTITATATVNSTNLSATGTLTVAPPTIGSIQFISATPSTITLKGVGGTETPTVVFKVVDSTGGPVPGATVSFTLSSTAGGLSLSPASAITGNDGSAQTVVQSGTVPTTASVTATVTTPGGTISTQSSALLVSTGFPTESGFSLSVATFNPEGGTLDGTTDAITARLVDNFGNPVPDGTQVYFTTTGGSIQPGCTTKGGGCSVTWTSQNPRPDPAIKPPAVKFHAEILAYAIGEESWTDANANGIFDTGDTFSVYPGSPAAGDNFYLAGPLYDDIGELYLDQDETGTYKLGDFFFDFNHDGSRNGPDGDFHGAGCIGNGGPAPVACSSATSIAVGAQTCLVMSTSQNQFPGVTPGVTTQSKGTTVVYAVSDMNGNVPAAGTTFGVAVNGTTVSVVNGGKEPSIPCSSSPPPNAAYLISVSVSGTSASGSFQITATSPSGLQSFSPSISVP
jgi:hypothetical protein